MFPSAEQVTQLANWQGLQAELSDERTKFVAHAVQTLASVQVAQFSIGHKHLPVEVRTYGALHVVHLDVSEVEQSWQFVAWQQAVDSRLRVPVEQAVHFDLSSAAHMLHFSTVEEQQSFLLELKNPELHLVQTVRSSFEQSLQSETADV